jgi:putative ABC transport system permease protein
VRALRRKLLRDARRQRAQFVAITVTVFLGVTVYAATYDSFRNLEASYNQTAEEFHFANLFVSGGNPALFAAAAADTDGVEAVEVRLVADVPFRLGEHKLLGRVVSLPAEGQATVNQLKVLRGSALDPASPTVLVEEHLADEFDLAPGDTLEVLSAGAWVTVTVAGVASSPEYIWPARSRQDLLTSPEDFGVIFATADTAAALVGAPANEAVVYYENGEPDAALTATLADAAIDAGAVDTYTREQQASNAALEEDLRGFEEMALFFPILFLIAASMAAYVMINRLVYAQRPQIGILLAEGYTHRQIRRHYLGYGLLPALAGAVPGVVVGVLLARAITGWYTSIISVPVKVIEFRPTTAAIGLVVGLLVAVAAAWAPARTASRMVPAEVMRGLTPAGRGRRSIPEKLIPPLRRLPIRWRMALRGIERSPRRTLYTILGIVLSLMLVLVSWGMIDTMRHLVNRQFFDIQREDARLYFSAPLAAAQVATLSDIPGVASVEPSLEVPVSITAGTEQYATALVILEPGTAMHGFYGNDGGEFELGEGGVIAGSALSGLLGIDTGDDVAVTAPDLELVARAPVIGFANEPMGTLLYASRTTAAALSGSDVPATSALVRFEADADRAQMRTVLSELPNVAAFRDAKGLYDVMQDYMGLFYGFVGLMLVFGAAMAFALIFNAMSVNIAERTREVATLMAEGMSKATISRLITSENLVVALIGIPPGLLLGYWVSSLAMGSFNTDLFRFDLFMQWTTLLWSALAIVAVALVSQWPGLRAVRRLDIPRIVKERAG